MIEVKEAQQIILEQIRPLEEESIELTVALGRILNEEIYANEDSPSFDSSAMDGYALVASDTVDASRDHPVVLGIIEDLPAGSIPSKTVTPGYASRIMTGAAMPKGADAVIMAEDTEKTQSSRLKAQSEEKKTEKIRIFREVKKGENIRRVGEDVRKGDLILKKGIRIRPSVIGMLASLGRTTIKTIRPPVVAILATGDELIEPGGKLTPGKIYNSNTYSLMAQVIEAGAIPLNLGIARDKKGAFGEKIRKGLLADLIITSAGVSVGEYDLVKDVLKEMGLKLLFWKVAIKPGKPTVFGLIQGKPYFGLPGYPVSSMICFELFARPAILAMIGRKRLFRPRVKAVTLEDIKKKVGRTDYLRAVISYNRKLKRYEANLTGPQKSGILSSMVKASSLLVTPKEASFIKSGSTLEAMLLRHSILQT